MEQWAHSVFQGETIEESALKNEGSLGEVRVLRRLANLTYEEFHEGLTDDEHERSEDEKESKADQDIEE